MCLEEGFKNCSLCTLCLSLCRSKTFCPLYANVGEIHAVIPPGTPLIALTATATQAIRHDITMKLESKFVHVTPNRPNTYFEVRPHTNIDVDMAPVVHDLKKEKQKAQRVLVYCRSLNMCANLYAHFCYALGDDGIILMMPSKSDYLECTMPKLQHTTRSVYESSPF